MDTYIDWNRGKILLMVVLVRTKIDTVPSALLGLLPGQVVVEDLEWLIPSFEVAGKIYQSMLLSAFVNALGGGVGNGEGADST